MTDAERVAIEEALSEVGFSASEVPRLIFEHHRRTTKSPVLPKVGR